MARPLVMPPLAWISTLKTIASTISCTSACHSAAGIRLWIVWMQTEAEREIGDGDPDEQAGMHAADTAAG